MKNYYHILGLNEDAGQSDIKKAFKKLAVIHHPDKNVGNIQSEEIFKEINEAYQTLTNPQLKAAYDLLLLNFKYQQQAAQNRRSAYRSENQNGRARRQTATQNRPFQRQHKAHRARYNREEDQKKGLLWAFSIIGAIALVVTVTIGIYSFSNYLDKQALKEKEKALKERLAQNISSDSVSILLDEVNAEIEQRKGMADSDLREFKKAIIVEIKKQAHSHFNNKAYQKALDYYFIWKKYAPSDLVLLNTRLALCHKNTGNYTQAEAILYNMIDQKQTVIFAHTELGRIAEFYLKNDSLAAKHYLAATNASIADYVKKYGKAYGIYMDPTRLPELQYEVFLAKGRVLERLGETGDAIIACNWASMIRPNKPEAYFVKGNAEHKANNLPIACVDWEKAISFGFAKAQEQLNQYCK